MQPHRGTLILVLGILGLIMCSPLGIFAWVMGSHDLKEMAAGRMDRSGEGSTNGGRICGIIASVFLGIAFMVGIVVFLLILLGVMAGSR